MELALTFGAVGDFIAVLELIQKVVIALDDSRGSTKEYRDVVQSLQILERTITHVKDVYSDQSPSSVHDDLRAIALCIVAKIKEYLEDFCDKTWKFGPSLANGGTKNVFRDAARKIQWKFRQKDVEKLHNDLSRLSMPLNMVLEMTTLRAVQRGHEATTKQMKESETRTSAIFRDSSQSIMEYFGAFEALVLSNLDIMSKLRTDSNTSAIQIIRMVNAVSNDLNSIKSMLMRLERPLSEEQFIFEDVSGKVFPIHLRTVTSWEAFEFILADHFKGRKGARRIQRGHYSIQERATGRGVSRSVDWQSAFFPNQRIDMSMMCRQAQDATLTASSASCPRCLTVSPGETGVEIQCTKCNMFFTRVVELDDAPIPAFAPTPPQRAHTPGEPPFERRIDGENDGSSINTPGPGNRGSGRPRSLSLEEQSDSDDEDIQGFVRIMLISKQKKAMHHATKVTENLLDGPEATSQTNPQDPGALGNLVAVKEFVEARADTTSNVDQLSKASSDNAQTDTTLHTIEAKPSPRPQPKPATSKSNEKKEFTYPTRAASEEDRKRWKIRPGYSLAHWDPTQEPILLMGSVFDTCSLGKWIYDWAVYCHGPSTPISDMAADFWLLIISLSGNRQRAEATVEQVRRPESKEVLNDFIELGERLAGRIQELLKVCEAPIMKSARESGQKSGQSLSREAGVEFIETMFGRGKEFEITELIMSGLRLFGLHFHTYAEDIIRNPGA